MEEKLYEHVAWDTNTFGYKVARITASQVSPVSLTKLLSLLKHQGYQLVYWSVNPENIFLNIVAEQAGGLLADEKLTFTTLLSTGLLLKQNTGFAIEPYVQPEAFADLQRLALQSGTYSRFKRDPHFKNQEFEKLYTAWLQNSISKNVARKVFIYHLEGKILGFITLVEK
ncbi:MAG: hypothetical protein M3142_03015, partial [Bacteroidota bacterium]|nr:hypothetical protein [Bacteroidota bacterium]